MSVDIFFNMSDWTNKCPRYRSGENSLIKQFLKTRKLDKNLPKSIEMGKTPQTHMQTPGTTERSHLLLGDAVAGAGEGAGEGCGIVIQYHARQ